MTLSQPPLDDSIYDGEFKKLPVGRADKTSRAHLILDVVNQLRTGKDAWRISLPCQLLAPTSMLEYMSYFVTPNEYILSTWKKLIPEQRFLDVLMWWLSNISKAPAKGIFHSKPYNPALGEVFSCQFKHSNDSISHYISEQVSHHPPISTFYITNRRSNFACKATFHPKIKFHGNSASNIMDGHLKCFFTNLNEEYQVTFPHFCASGLLLGSQRIEVNHIMTIECKENGFQCELTFKSNKVKGKILENGKRIYKVVGSIDAQVFAKDDRSKKEFLLIDTTKTKQPKMVCRPLEKQAEIESRRLWHSVTYNIMKEVDYSVSNEFKKVIEEEQRRVRKESSEPWTTRFFESVPDHVDDKLPEYRCIFEDLNPYREEEEDLSKKHPIFNMDVDLSKGIDL